MHFDPFVPNAPFLYSLKIKGALGTNELKDKSQFTLTKIARGKALKLLQVKPLDT